MNPSNVTRRGMIGGLVAGAGAAGAISSTFIESARAHALGKRLSR